MVSRPGCPRGRHRSFSRLAFTQHGITRDALCDLFWPDREERQARNSLRQTLAAIRRFLPADASGMHLDGNLETVELTAEARDVDVWHFDALLATGEPSTLVQAADLYRGTSWRASN